MKTRNDDFSGAEYPQEHNIGMELTFSSPDGKYYKATLDVSPSSFLGTIVKACIRKPFPWEEFVRFTEAEQAEELRKKPSSKRKGIYKPATNVNAIIATLVEEKISQ
jgi:hypothetical protein